MKSAAGQKSLKGEPFSVRFTRPTDRTRRQFAEIVTGVERQLDLWPSQKQWRDLAIAF